MALLTDAVVTCAAVTAAATAVTLNAAALATSFIIAAGAGVFALRRLPFTPCFLPLVTAIFLGDCYFCDTF